MWAGRAVIWAAILLVGYRGVLAIFTGPAPAARQASAPAARGTGGTPNGAAGRAATGQTAAGAAAAFPAAAAEAFALEFGNVYLNFSPEAAAARSRALAAFLPRGADPQLGWNGAGAGKLLDEQVAGITVSSAHDAVVMLLARLGSGKLIELGVPVYASGGAMSVSGEPALLPGPGRAAVPAAGTAPADPAAESALRTQLAAFFPAYASGDAGTLTRFLTPGTRLAGLGGAVSLGAIDSVYAPAGGATRAISVTVTWMLPRMAGRPRSAGLQMTYAMTVVRRGGTWDISSISAGAPAT